MLSSPFVLCSSCVTHDPTHNPRHPLVFPPSSDRYELDGVDQWEAMTANKSEAISRTLSPRNETLLNVDNVTNKDAAFIWVDPETGKQWKLIEGEVGVMVELQNWISLFYVPAGPSPPLDLPKLADESLLVCDKRDGVRGRQLRPAVLVREH